MDGEGVHVNLWRQDRSAAFAGGNLMRVKLALLGLAFVTTLLVLPTRAADVRSVQVQIR